MNHFSYDQSDALRYMKLRKYQFRKISQCVVAANAAATRMLSSENDGNSMATQVVFSMMNI